MKEIWKVIPGFPKYQVSNFGEVCGPKGILKGKSNYRRGKRVTIYEDGSRKTFSIARLVAFTFFEKDIFDHSLTVNHKDCNRFNNCIENLELISSIENMRNGFRDGLYITHRVDVFDMNTWVKKTYSSASSASRAMGKHSCYLSKKENGIHIIGNYMVKIYPKNKYFFVDRGIPDYTKE